MHKKVKIYVVRENYSNVGCNESLKHEIIKTLVNNNDRLPILKVTVQFFYLYKLHTKYSFLLFQLDVKHNQHSISRIFVWT